VQFNPLDPSLQFLKSVGSTTATNVERRESNRDQTQTPLSWDDDPAPFDLFIAADYFKVTQCPDWTGLRKCRTAKRYFSNSDEIIGRDSTRHKHNHSILAIPAATMLP
jgi:hypothetical protein